MANEEGALYISELPSTAQVGDTDYFVTDDGSQNYKVPWSVLKSLLGSVTHFETDPDTAHYPGYLKLTLANGAVLRAKPSDPDKQEKLTFDSTPKQGSQNPVTSGGVFAALGLKLSTENYVNFTGATDQADGSAGKVPAPAAGGARYLGSEGSWLAPDSTPTEGSSRLLTSGGAKAAIVAALCRPNLLTNGYFAGGGSHLGDGVFPINQRGQAAYSAAGYFIDQWKRTTGTTGTITLHADGLTADAKLFVRQANDIKPQLVGKTLTFSILYKVGGLKSVTHVLEENGRFSMSNADLPLPTYSSTGTQLTNELAGFYVIPDDYIVAVKLELGDTQTLAHQENGAWVLNELPDYSTELQKCRRYYQRYMQSGANMGFVLGNVMAFSASSVNLTLRLSMRPPSDHALTVTYSNLAHIVLAATTIDSGIQADSITVPRITDSGDAVIRVNASGLTAGDVYNLALKAGVNAWIAFSTEP